MGSANAGYEYKEAEGNYLSSKTLEDRIFWLQEMIRFCPKHKSSEKMLSELKIRLIKLKAKQEKAKKAGKGKKAGIKKQDMQCLLVGFTNTGKSSIFQILANQPSETSPYPFTTTHPILGTLKYEDVNIQLIDIPSFPNTDFSLINCADTLMLVVDSLEQILPSLEFTKKSKAKKILIFNKVDLLSEEQKRKLQATLDSKYKKLFERIFLFSAQSPENNSINELKKAVFQSFPIIRVYTKEPKKMPSPEPVIMKPNSTTLEIAEKIAKGFSKKVKRIRIWGPSSKFGGQIVGEEHILKDRDIIEFQTS